MIHLYVAGKYSSDSLDEIEFNILAAEAVAAQVIEATDRVVCLVPHSLGRNFKRGPGSPQYWYDATLSLLKRCDALLLVPGWETSSGTINEVAWCRENDVPVYDSVEAFLGWVERIDEERL